MNDLTDTNTLHKLLLQCAQNGELKSYKTMIDDLAIPPGHSMRTLTAMLEACQEDDALLNRPQLASLVIQKTGKPIPRAGFFIKLTELGLYDGDQEGPAAEMWHRNEVERVFRYYQGKR